MRIDALKYRTEDQQDIIIVVDLQVGYGYQNNNVWQIVDIGYKTSRQRKYTYLSTTIRDRYEYRQMDQKGREQYVKEQYVKFVGEDKLKEAVMEAWKSIKLDLENLSFVSA